MTDTPSTPPTDTGSTLENTATDPGKRLIELLLKVVTAGVSVAGVALVGQAVAWARFDAADLPANQAITYLGQDERVSIGGLTLAGFVLAGAVAVAIVFALDRQANPDTPASRWGLISLMVAGVIGGSLMSLGGRWEFWVAAGLVLVTVAVIWYATKGVEAKTPSQRTKGEKRSLWLGRLIPLVILALLLIIPGIINGGEAWFPLLFLGVVLLLGWISRGIGKRTGTIFRWYGVAIFLSVVLFGGVLTAARTFNEPKVQSVAVLFQNGDGVSGIYVADNDKRIYVGSVESREGNEVKENSGAIFWIPCERVQTYAVGALQSTSVALDRGKALLEELKAQPAVTSEPTAEPETTQGAEENSGGSCSG